MRVSGLSCPYAPVGCDVVVRVDHARRGWRLLPTRWYPAANGARQVAAYTSPLSIREAVRSIALSASVEVLRRRVELVPEAPVDAVPAAQRAARVAVGHHAGL